LLSLFPGHAHGQSPFPSRAPRPPPLLPSNRQRPPTCGRGLGALPPASSSLDLPLPLRTAGPPYLLPLPAQPSPGVAQHQEPSRSAESTLHGRNSGLKGPTRTPSMSVALTGKDYSSRVMAKPVLGSFIIEPEGEPKKILRVTAARLGLSPPWAARDQLCANTFPPQIGRIRHLLCCANGACPTTNRRPEMHTNERKAEFCHSRGRNRPTGRAP